MSCDVKYQTAYTAENLIELEKAIASGVQKVKYSDKEIWYQSLADMLKVRELMKSSLGLNKKCGEKGLFGGRRVKAIHSKGLDSCD